MSGYVWLVLVDGVETDHADTRAGANRARDVIVYSGTAPAESVTIVRRRRKAVG